MSVPHERGVTGALIRGFFKYLELLQLQDHVELVILYESNLVTLKRDVIFLTLMLNNVVKFWKSLGSAVAFLAMHCLVALVTVQPQSPVEF